jgi:methylated-DNA-[protein]-cysteine S-methyltransferase
MKTYAAVLSAPTFSIGIECNADEITGIDYLEPRAELAPRTPLAKEAVRQLRAWLADPAFEFGLPLAPAGTHYQRRVWKQISAIPVGQTRSYGEVAAAIGSGSRAVGNACGRNPYPIVVPCHRVVAANHGLGGFGGKSARPPSPSPGDGVTGVRFAPGHGGSGLGRPGAGTRGGFLLDIKRWLLSHEHAQL